MYVSLICINCYVKGLERGDDSLARDKTIDANDDEEHFILINQTISVLE